MKQNNCQNNKGCRTVDLGKLSFVSVSDGDAKQRCSATVYDIGITFKVLNPNQPAAIILIKALQTGCRIYAEGELDMKKTGLLAIVLSIMLAFSGSAGVQAAGSTAAAAGNTAAATAAAQLQNPAVLQLAQTLTVLYASNPMYQQLYAAGFDAIYYAINNPQVAVKTNYDPAAMYNDFLTVGSKAGKLPSDPAFTATLQALLGTSAAATATAATVKATAAAAANTAAAAAAAKSTAAQVVQVAKGTNAGKTVTLPQTIAGGQTYVLNINTMKFHRPGCSSASDIYPQNRYTVTSTAAAVEAAGFSPCGRCNPQ